MPQSGITFTTTRSGESPKQALIRLRKDMRPNVGDALYAGQRQRTRILERTERGVDVNGKPFAPYSQNGPYYYNPNGRTGGASESGQKSAAKRFLGKITTAAERKQDGAPRLSRTGRSVRFPSYAAFKQWLGRKAVDLRGPRAPHMLQGIILKVNGAGGEAASEEPARDMRMGIYGEAADRATGHQQGARHLPQRKFFGASVADVKQMAADIKARISARIKG